MELEECISNLQKFGLTKGEAKVYLALLKGNSTKSGIMKSSGVSSSVVYRILEGLIKKGLASHMAVEGKKKFYPASPEKLLDLIKNEKEKVKELEQTGKRIIPFLNQISEQRVVFANIYKGSKGLKAMLKEVEGSLDDIGEWLAMGVTSHKREFFNRLWIDWHKNVRPKYKTKAKFLFCEKDTKYYKALKEVPLSKVKYLTSIPLSCITVAGKLSLIMKYANPPHFLLIKDKDIAKTMREIFKFLWRTAKN